MSNDRAGSTLPRDQAGASGWLTDENVRWPSQTLAEGVAGRRRDLYGAMKRLESAVARPSGLPDWRIEIESALADLEKSLQTHVDQVESDQGLFSQIIDQGPHLAPHVETLESEHTELLSACHTALSMAADWSSPALRRRANSLLVRLALHRQNGAELLYDAYNVDIAAGD